MQAHEYRTLFEFESFYWWYKAIHAILLDTLRTAGVGRGARVLDAGCGTGRNLANVISELACDGYGLDFARHAAEFWASRGLERACVASINEIPFPDASFQAVMSVDVLECQAVHESTAVGELCRVLAPGGLLVLVVPAYDWLLNPEHHEAVAAVRRYTRPRVARLLTGHPVELVRMTHLFASVFPAVAAYRLIDRLKPRRSSGPARSDLKPLHPVLNDLLYRLLDAERMLLRRKDMPFGSSIMAVARRT